MTEQLKTPIAFIIFNRPKCTRQVFERIRDARPEKLYLIADAARVHKSGETEKCAETRRIVEDMIDWPCEVHKNYAEKNMGCGQRIISGLNWLFNHEDSAIILEDDILPNATFFPFCSEMLKLYSEDERVMQIAGYNELQYQAKDQSSYIFSRYTPIWGWATWKRAWICYQDSILESEHIKTCLYKNNYSSIEAELLISRIRMIESGLLDTWDIHWRASCLYQDGLSIIPSKNLIKNIGFGTDATHTISPLNLQRWKQTNPLVFPLRHPSRIDIDQRHENSLSLKRKLTTKVEQIKDVIFQHLPFSNPH